MNKANVNKLGYVGKVPQSPRDSDSWYTPLKYLESARKVFGGEISLDPFSSEKANEKVKAVQFYTIEDNALSIEWNTSGKKTVWMNPPYGKTMSAAVNKFIEQYSKGNFLEGIVLCNNATDTKWFSLLADNSSSFCFTNHRISFEQYDGKNVSGNTRGQTFLYFGKQSHLFKDEFSSYGLILIPG